MTLIRHHYVRHRPQNHTLFVWLDMPPNLACAIVGHKPTHRVLPSVDAEWMECGRCTIRPEAPAVGTKGTQPSGVMRQVADPAEYERLVDARRLYWPTREADFHVEVSTRRNDRVGVGASIGTAGSETPIDAHVVTPVGGVFVGTDVFGKRWAHWRSRTKGTYNAAYTGVDVDRRGLSWHVAANRNESSVNDPWWRHGRVWWADVLYGKARNNRVTIATQPISIDLPEGTYTGTVEVTMLVEKRPRRTRTRLMGWVVMARLVPDGSEHWGEPDGIFATSVTIPETAVVGDTVDPEWWDDAARQMRSHVIRNRVKYKGETWVPDPADYPVKS